MHCVFSERAEAVKKLNAAVADKEKNLPVATPKQTVAQFLKRWLEESAVPSVRPRTATRYRELVELHIVPTLGRTLLTKLTPQDLQSLYAAKLAAGLAPRTVGHIHRVLHRALGQALRWGLVARNVSDAVDPPKVVRAQLLQERGVQARRRALWSEGHHR